MWEPWITVVGIGEEVGRDGVILPLVKSAEIHNRQPKGQASTVLTNSRIQHEVD